MKTGLWLLALGLFAGWQPEVVSQLYHKSTHTDTLTLTKNSNHQTSRLSREATPAGRKSPAPRLSNIDGSGNILTQSH